MLRKNVLLKQTNIKEINTSICSNSSFTSNLDEYETAFEDDGSDVSAYYSFSENIEPTVSDENVPVKSLDQIPNKAAVEKREPAGILNDISNNPKTVICEDQDHVENTEEPTAEGKIEDISKNRNVLDTEEKASSASEEISDENIEVTSNGSSQPTENENHEQEKEEVEVKQNQGMDISQIEDRIKEDSVSESKSSSKQLPEIPESDEPDENVVKITTSLEKIDVTETESKVYQDETRNKFIKKYRETIETHPFNDIEKELADGITLMSFPAETPSETVNPFITNTAIQSKTSNDNNVKKADPQPRKILTRRSMLLSKIPMNDKRKSVIPAAQPQKRKIGKISPIDEKPPVKRTRQTLIPRKAEPEKLAVKTSKVHEPLNCRWCDRVFQISSALQHHQEEYCTKIPDKERRKLLIDSYKKNTEMPPPPQIPSMKSRKSIVPPSSVVTRNQARLSIGQPIYSGIVRTPSKT
jgi:hypothetical protein